MQNKFVLKNKIYCCEIIPNKMNKIVIYCHGFGGNKEGIYRHNEILNKNNIGIISFDFPCHGEDLSDDKEFNLTNSINYLNEVIEYSRKFNVPISLVGSSFGGYVVLNRINNINEKFDKVFLKYPAVNFFECAKRITKIDIEYFDNNISFTLPNGKQLFKETFIEFMNGNIMDEFNKNGNDIYVIHGDKDEVVYLKDVESFCNKNDIPLKVIKGASHGMKDCLDVANLELINFLKK